MGVKTCSKCGETKLIKLFSKNKARGGLQAWCKSCMSSYYRENKERHKELARKRRVENRDHYIEKSREYYARTRDEHIARNRWSLYGLTPERYAELFDVHAGVCAICGGVDEKRSLHIDHDHSCCEGRKSCGKCIRGLLCHK